MQDHEYTALDYVKGGIFLIWFIGSIVALFLTLKISPWLTLAVFGQYFLVFGLITLVSGIKAHNFNAIFLLFLLVGLLTVIWGVGLYLGNETTQATLKQYFPYAGVSIFFFTGVFCILNNFIRVSREKKCTTLVQATCIDIKKRRRQTNEGGNTRAFRYLYCPVFGFNYNGKSYEVSTNFFTIGVTAELGEQYDLYINPEYPNCFKEEGESGRQGATELVLGIFFIIVSSFVLALLFILS